jgi:hypothetical protein
VGVRGGIVRWCFACLCGFIRFLGGLLLAVGLFWLVDGFLVRLCGGFAVYIGGFLGVCLI